MIRGLHTEKYDVFALQIGMYISSLDIPWSATDFPLKGFKIQSKQEINKLIKLCNYVYVDVTRSETLKTRTIRPMESMNTARIGKIDLAGEKAKPGYGGMSNAQVSARLASFKCQTYPKVSKFRNEVKVAEVLLENAETQLFQIVENNKELSTADILHLNHITRKIVSSAIRNPDALMWLCKIKNADKKIYSQVLSSMVTGAVFARHLGLAENKIEVLAEALLYRGIGLTRLPKSVVQSNQPGKESLAYFKHVDLTIEALANFNESDKLVINTIQNHCERFDGNGYPANKPAQRIPLLAQMMGIVTFFESWVNPSVEAYAISSSSAVTKLFEVGNKQFSKQLIEHFVQSMGIYPVGCLVELNDGSTAMVVEQTESQRLRPKVAIIQNVNKEILTEPQLIDLFDTEEANGLSISRGVPRSRIPAKYLNLDTSIRLEKDKISRWFEPMKKISGAKLMSFF